MIVLFTHPEQVLHEQEKIGEMMLMNAGLLVHIRKPEWNENTMRLFLDGLKEELYPRIVLHQHSQLAPVYGLKGGHTKDGERTAVQPGHVSTSVHSMEDARKHGLLYDYFFCSPVFPSISKLGYSCDENWNIKGEPDSFRSKAVALGGVDASRHEQLQQLGFSNYGFLGAVWYTENPVKSFGDLTQVFDK